MREGWEQVTLQDVTSLLRRGITPRYVDAGALDSITVINQKCINHGQVNLDHAKTTARIPALKEDRILRAGDVLVCSTGRGTLGRTAMWNSDVPATADSHVTILRPGAKVVAAYAAAALSALEPEIEALGAGSTNMTELSPAALSRLRIPFPPIEEQRRIVDLIGAMDEAIEASEAHYLVANELYAELLVAAVSVDGPRQRLGMALSPSQSTASVVPNMAYRIAGLERSGKGFIDRGPTSGAEISYAKLTELAPDQLAYRKLTAWEGPISVTDEEIAGAWVSSEFPVFDIDRQVLLPGLLRHICRWPGFWQMMADRLTGSVLRRKRLNPSQLLEIELPIPAVEEQEGILELLDAGWSALTESDASAIALRTLRSELLAALLSGSHTIPESYDRVMESVGS